MKRVLFINPNTEKSPYPVAPVGLCMVASALRAQFEVRIFDGTFRGADGLTETVAAFNPDFVCVGIRNVDDVTSGVGNYYIDAVRRDFIEPVRSVSGAPVILGGAGFSLFPAMLLRECRADYGIAGEGENLLLRLLNTLVAGESPAKLEGVLRPGDDVSPDLEMPRGTRELRIPFSEVDTFIDFSPYRERGSYPIQTKRGCGLKCVYCSYPLIEGREYRLRHPSLIVDEIEAAAGRLGAVTFEFVDSTFNAPLAHAEAICREIIRRGLKVRLRSMGINPGGVTDRLLELMRRAGFRQIVCSADTASSVTLRSYRKGFSKNRLERAAALIRKHDMPTMWSFIFGGPKETRDTVEESFRFIEDWVHPLDMVHMTEGIRIYPRTPIFEIACKEGIISKTTPLLRPFFYISPSLGAALLTELLRAKSKKHLNCILATESGPSPELLRRASALRGADGVEEPMFRTLLRLRRADMAIQSDL